MLKIIQITDCHLVPPGETIFGSDPIARLQACIADINRNHADAALCVLTGDLAHHADAQAYRTLEKCLDGLAVPFRLLMGNHDERAALRRAFPDTEVDEHGFVQSGLDTPAARLLFLDTTRMGRHDGAYCELRRSWLRARLAETGASQSVYLFMHHPPFRIELPHLDQYRMDDDDAAALAALLRASENVRHIFFGHVHRPVSGSWHGIPFSALRGTNHQSWLDFSDRRENICSLEPPAYGIIFLDHDRTIMHAHDFLDASAKYVYDPAAGVGDQVRLLAQAESPA